jgi:uncharacterized membrane protein YjgN (DUF898 family)
MRIPNLIWAAICLIAASTAWAQPAADVADRWRQQMAAAEEVGHELPHLQDALKTAEPFGEADPRLFETVVRLAVFCLDDENNCASLGTTYLDRALHLRETVRPKDAHIADLLMQLGSAASLLERYREGILVYAQARDIRESLFGPRDQKVAESWAAEAWLYHWLKDEAQARRTMQYALELREDAGAAQQAGFAELLEESARLYANERDAPAAEKEYGRAIAIQERLWGVSDPRFTESLNAIADLNRDTALNGFSGKLYRRVVDIQKTAHGERSQESYAALFDLGEYFKEGKRFREAEETFQAAYTILQNLGKKDLATALCLEELARSRFGQDHYTEAGEAAERSLALRAPLERTSDVGTVSLYAFLAETYLLARDEHKSEDFFRTLTTAAVPDHRWILIAAAEKLSGYYQDRGDLSQAAVKMEVAVAAIEAGNPNDPRLEAQLQRLSRLYQTMGRTEDANRINGAILRQASASVLNAGADAQRAMIIGLAVLFGIPLIGIVGCGLLFRMLARGADRNLADLFLVRQPEPVPPPLPEWFAPAEVVAASPADISAPAVDGVAPALSLTAVSVLEAPAVDELIEPGSAAPLETESEPEASPRIVTPPPLPVMPPTPEPSAVSQVSLLADGSVLFAIRALNLLLSLLTLGIYSFWGKAKVRRYVCGQAEFLGDRFAFHGNGRELLLGWLRALPALAFVFLFPSVLPLLWQNQYSAVVGQIGVVAAFLVLWPVARVGAYRYRLNRMSWRGIRFSYRGAGLRYLGASLLGSLFTLLTLGFYAPFLEVRLESLLSNDTYFGDAPLRYSGRGSDLLPAWLFALPLSFCSMGIAWAWWSALQHRYNWAHTTFAGARFRCTVTGGQLLWLWVGNALIVIPTLGLGMSWAMLRTLRFWTRHIQLVGDLNLAPIRQDARATSAIGESFADFLGFDFGF